MKYELRTVRLEEVKVGTRARADLGNQEFEDLVKSIAEYGIIQPITLNADLKLLAGGRRYEAAKLLKMDSVPALIKLDTTEVSELEIELFENLHRKSLTWSEEAKLYKKIDDYYREKVGQPWKWSQQKTAEVMGVSRPLVNRKLQVAAALEQVPELATLAKNEDDALKMIKKLQESIVIDELKAKHKAEAAQRQAANESHAYDHYRVGDAISNMADLVEIYKEMGSTSAISFIEVDPPYGIDIKETKKGDSEELQRYTEVEAKNYPDFLRRVAELTYQCAGKDCWMVFWFGIQWYSDVKVALLAAGWDVDVIPGLWFKRHGQTQSPEVNLASAYEAFFVCRKGQPVLRQRGRMNVFDFAPVAASKKFHPTQRPLELMQELLRTFAYPSAIVMIPFLGSGVTLRAAYKEGMTGFGWDLDEKNKDGFILSTQEDLANAESSDTTVEAEEPDESTDEDSLELWPDADADEGAADTV